MNYQELNIQTQRNAPANARTESYKLLNRAGYIPRIEPDFALLALGERALSHLRDLVEKAAGSGSDISIEAEAHHGLGLFGVPASLGIEICREKADAQTAQTLFTELGLQTILTTEADDIKGIFFPLETGNIDLLSCAGCGITTRADLAQFRKMALPEETPLPLEKIHTPHCPTIEALANYLEIPQEKTAKALLFTCESDGKLVLCMVRGDMNLSETKLAQLVGKTHPATEAEIAAAGAVPGYASPVDLGETLVVVDTLLPVSTNLVAGANQRDYHLMNVNFGRDYNASLVADLVQARAGDHCIHCDEKLTGIRVEQLYEQHGLSGRFDLGRILAALAETHTDDFGLRLPAPVAPFDVYLMAVPGKNMDTFAPASDLYRKLQKAGVDVLLDNREERAGVKFNDADLIGCPLRITIGERKLQEGMVELKQRTAKEKLSVPLENIIQEIQRLLK
ncbi:MAG: hypothetical protein JXA13_02590 [Anaerolineales bacterium]|nr:hypothetical protein [Anaerolineales bacterium]